MRRYGIMLLVVVILLLLGLLVYGLTLVPRGVLLAWAVLVTVFLPVAALGGWMLGRYEAGAVLHGFDLAVERVAGVLLRTRSEPKAPTPVATMSAFPSLIHLTSEGEVETVDL